MEIQTKVQKGQHLYTFGEYSVEVDSIYGGCDPPFERIGQKIYILDEGSTEYYGPTPSPFERPAKPLPVNEDKGVDDET